MSAPKRVSAPKKAVPTPTARSGKAATAPAKAARRATAALPKPPDRKSPPEALTRARRQWVDVDVEPADATDRRFAASVKTGGEELKQLLGQHPEASPALTAGDIDAKWTEADAIGDEAPGGDNPTPDQDRVDDIGKALGVSYEDNEELRGSDKIVERDRHRWELDPASSDDWPHDRD